MYVGISNLWSIMQDWLQTWSLSWSYHWRKGDCNSYILSTLYICSLLHVSILSHRCSTTVSLEIYPLYSFYYYLIFFFFNTLHKIFSLKNLIVMIFFFSGFKTWTGENKENKHSSLHPWTTSPAHGWDTRFHLQLPTSPW